MAQRLRKAKTSGAATGESHRERESHSEGAVDFAAALEEAKLRALYQFAYGLSHEINNPLTNIATRAQTLMVNEQDPQRRRKLAVIVQQAFRAHEMIADLMLFANPPAMRPEHTDLEKVIATVLSELKPLATEKKIRLTRGGDAGSVFATVDPVQLAVAIKAVVQNALEAVGEKGLVEVRLSTASGAASVPQLDPPHAAVPAPKLKGNHKPLAAKSFHLLTVKDNGPGIAAETREHIFDPYFSGREAGRGLGLGLSKAWRIVDLHGGRIDVLSPEGGGAEFRIAIPADGD
jgi:signal transduction histidine kinase